MTELGEFSQRDGVAILPIKKIENRMTAFTLSATDVRSRVETKMHCVKLLGQRLSARDFNRQVAEIQIRAAFLNGFTALGIPRTVAVG